RRHGALEPLPRIWARVAQQAKPNLPVREDLEAAFGISGCSGQRLRDRIARHRIGPQLLRCRGRAGEQSGRYHPPLQPNTSPVIVLNQPSANWASSVRFSRGASSGLTPPEPSTSASTPSFGLYTPATVMP